MKNKLLKKVICEVLGLRKIKKLKKDFSGEYDPVYSIEYKTHRESEFDGGVLLLNKDELTQLCKKYIIKKGYTLQTTTHEEREVEAIITKTSSAGVIKTCFKKLMIFKKVILPTEHEAMLEMVKHIIRNQDV